MNKLLLSIVSLSFVATANAGVDVNDYPTNSSSPNPATTRSYNPPNRQVTPYANTQMTSVKPLDVERVQIVKPEVTTPVQLSNIDVNRIKCQSGNINDVFYSEEKGIVVTTEKDNLFIKYQIKELINANASVRRDYVTVRTEFFITCNGEVFTLLALPEQVPSKTILLTSGKRPDIEKNIETYKSMSLEERVIELTHQAIKNELPSSATIKPFKNQFKYRSPQSKNAIIKHDRQIILEGLGLVLNEYTYRANEALQEKDFLSSRFGKNLVGVTLLTNDNLNGKAYLVAITTAQEAN